MTFLKTTTAVQNKTYFSLNDSERNVVREIRVDCSGSASNELNIVICIRSMCAYNFKDTSATPIIHLIACHCNIATQV